MAHGARSTKKMDKVSSMGYQLLAMKPPLWILVFTMISSLAVGGHEKGQVLFEDRYERRGLNSLKSDTTSPRFSPEMQHIWIHTPEKAKGHAGVR